MSNDFNITPGSGAKAATYDDGTAHHQRMIPGKCSTAAVTGVSSSASSGTLIAANARVRAGLVVHNNSTATLYVRYSATAAAISSGSYTYQILPNQTWEMPSPIYDGAITCIWDAANGYANVTEMTI